MAAVDDDSASDSSYFDWLGLCARFDLGVGLVGDGRISAMISGSGDGGNVVGKSGKSDKGDEFAIIQSVGFDHA